MFKVPTRWIGFLACTLVLPRKTRSDHRQKATQEHVSSKHRGRSFAKKGLRMTEVDISLVTHAPN